MRSCQVKGCRSSACNLDVFFYCLFPSPLGLHCCWESTSIQKIKAFEARQFQVQIQAQSFISCVTMTSLSLSFFICYLEDDNTHSSLLQRRLNMRINKPFSIAALAEQRHSKESLDISHVCYFVFQLIFLRVQKYMLTIDNLENTEKHNEII